MNLLPIFAELGTLPGWLVSLLVPLLLLCLAALIWVILPRFEPNTRRAREDARRAMDISRQIATLRKSADHAVTHRPRVRANGCSKPPAAHIKATPDWVHNGSIRGNGATQPAKPKACGGGICRKRIDCHDAHCPGHVEARMAARSAAKTH